MTVKELVEVLKDCPGDSVVCLPDFKDVKEIQEYKVEGVIILASEERGKKK